MLNGTPDKINVFVTLDFQSLVRLAFAWMESLMNIFVTDAPIDLILSGDLEFANVRLGTLSMEPNAFQIRMMVKIKLRTVLQVLSSINNKRNVLHALQAAYLVLIATLASSAQSIINMILSQPYALKFVVMESGIVKSAMMIITSTAMDVVWTAKSNLDGTVEEEAQLHLIFVKGLFLQLLL